MKIKGKTKWWDYIPCTSFFCRLKGNMGKKKIDNVLYFPKCNSIHTFFMKNKIDVVMIDKKEIIVAIFPNLSPWKIRSCKKASATLEFPAGENPYQLGDKIKKRK